LIKGTPYEIDKYPTGYTAFLYVVYLVVSISPLFPPRQVTEVVLSATVGITDDEGASSEPHQGCNNDHGPWLMVILATLSTTSSLSLMEVR
jgi:hypothetical protein